MLIEKDWLSFGHKFQDRCGHVISDANEVSPIFLQFLDAVWQLTQMFPQAFQFNEKYLVTILEHTYSCQYGTFVGNCEKQRSELKIREKTYSLWGYLVLLTNPLYLYHFFLQLSYLGNVQRRVCQPFIWEILSARSIASKSVATKY